MSILDDQDIKLSKTNIRSQLRKNDWDRTLWGSMIHKNDRHFYCYEKIINSDYTPEFYLYNGYGCLDVVYFPNDFKGYVNLCNLIDRKPNWVHGNIQGQLYVSLEATSGCKFNKLYEVHCYMDIESIFSHYKDILTTRPFKKTDIL